MFFSLCPAPCIGEEAGQKRADLFEFRWKRDAFPRAPAAAATRRIKRDTGVFFCFVFFIRERK
jgi:hypothetical protein